MKHFNSKIWNQVALVFFIASLSSCYTLNTHQSGKTLGKGNARVHGLAGYVIYPDFVDSTNTDVYYFSEAHGFASFGVRDDLDLGLFLGLGKTGLFVKHQFVGNLDTKFNISGGLNATMGLNQRSVLDSFSDDKDHQKLIELPLYVSYDFKKYFTVYSSPVLTYMNTDGSSNFVVGNDFYQNGFYRGLSGGLMINIPIKKEKIMLTLEGSWLSPLLENRYLYYTTAGIGFKFPTRWSKTPVVRE